MVKIIIVLIAIQYIVFRSQSRTRLLVRTRACTHLSITVVKLTVTYYVWFDVHS